jgi:NADPH2:quinone reductase
MRAIIHAEKGPSSVIYANNGGDTLPVDIRPTNALNLRYQFLLLYTLDPALLAAATEDVTAAVAAGALRVGEKAGLPLHHYPLDAAAAAHDAVERGVVGKVLIDIAAAP